MTAAIGVLKVAAMPAAAPQASSTLRSAAVVCRTWPTSEPRAPPVWMMGPSAPNGPPVPTEIAAEIGLSTATRGEMRLSLTSTASIASGMPWPEIFSLPYFTISPTTRPPAAGTTRIQGPRRFPSSPRSVSPMRWKKTRFETSAMSEYSP
jgi:hypothetical protein